MKNRKLSSRKWNWRYRKNY